MSKAALESVIRAAISDESFRKQLKQNPQAALSGYDLTSDERSAIMSGNDAKLKAMGVDDRMTKDAIFPSLWPPQGPQNQ